MKTHSKYRTFWKRLLSSIIDSIILSPLSILTNYTEDSEQVSFFWISIITSDLVYISYFAILHAKFGQTIGKRVVGIKVLDRNEDSLITTTRAFAREVPLLIISVAAMILILFNASDFSENKYQMAYNDCFLLASYTWIFLEVISMLTNKKRRAIHDWLSRSIVIKVPKD